MDDESATVAVKVLLESARLTVSVPEFERLVTNYPALRARADALYRLDLRDESPALAYDPLVDHASPEVL